MMRKIFLPLSTIFTLFIITSCSNSSTKKESLKRDSIDNHKVDSLTLVYDPKKADKQIDAFMQELHRKRGFNGNVLVAKQGKIIYEKAIGWADYLHRDSLKINSLFELASITKTMTSTAVMLLIERGKLSLDQNVKDFYPDFPYDGITIRLLLSHRSGLMNYVYFTDGIYKKEHRNERIGMSNQEAMAMICKYKPARYTKPDSKFHYNNSNYMILGAIIEKISGQSYTQFMKENIFIPAGMKNTAVYSKVDYEKKIPVDVVGHDRTWRYSVVQNFLDGPVGDKGIYSTVGDLLLFDRALRSGRLTSKASQDSSYVGRSIPERGHFNYGYGWRTFEDNNQQVAYHTGWWHGFRHIYLRDLKNDVTIVLLSNLTNGSLLQLDELFKMVGMPVVRRSAYHGNGNAADD